MIQVVVDNLGADSKFIFIIQKTHIEDYGLDSFLKKISPNCTVIEIDHLTEGPACTTLLAEKHINNNEGLLIANSDQFLEWDRESFFKSCNSSSADGSILTFKSTDPNCSYVKLGQNGCIAECREKERISNIGTVGIYFWKRGSNYVRFAKQMINKNIRTNNEFYICPVYNEAISNGLCIRNFPTDDVWQIGTPSDLDCFIKNYFPNPDSDPDIWANMPSQ
jgi:dTDP-glucose pyrophosphorylase